MKNIFTREWSSFIKIFQRLSLFPYSSNPIGHNLLISYSALNILAIGAICYSAIFIYHVVEVTGTIARLVAGLVFYGLLAVHVLNIIQTFLSRHNQKKITQKFNNIDFMLQNKLYININYRQLRRRLLLKYFTILAVLFAIHGTSIATVTITGHFVPYCFHLVPTVALLRFRCIQSMFYVDNLKEKFRLMNKKLKLIQAKQGKRIFFLFVNEFHQMTEQQLTAKRQNQLVALKRLQGNFLEVSNLINDCFGWSLLAIVKTMKSNVDTSLIVSCLQFTLYFIDFTTNAYWFFLVLDSLEDPSILIHCICAIVPIVVILMSLAYSCHQCTEYAQNTGILIHKIEENVSSDMQNDLVTLLHFKMLKSFMLIFRFENFPFKFFRNR